MSRMQMGKTFGLAVLAALAGGLLIAAVLNSRPAVGAALPVAATSVPAAGGATNRISVVGQGTVAATPDQATIGLGVAATRGNVADAVGAAGADMANLLKALHAEGVQDRDIQTAALYVGQEANCCPRSVTGYSASTQVSVLVHHVANVGSLIAAAVAAVGNDIQLNGVNLSLSDTAAEAKAARAAAMADATVRANQWANLAGRHLGGIISVSEAPLAPQFDGGCNGCGKGAGGGGIPVMAGRSQVQLTITVEYELVG